MDLLGGRLWGGWEVVGVLVGAGDDWGEAVGDLVRYYDCAVVEACQLSELSTETDELGGASCER